MKLNKRRKLHFIIHKINSICRSRIKSLYYLSLALMTLIVISPNLGYSRKHVLLKQNSSIDLTNIDNLISLHQYKDAEQILNKMQSELSGHNENLDQIKIVLKKAQLEITQNNFDTAFNLLNDKNWEKDELGSVLYKIFYAEMLTSYKNFYATPISNYTSTHIKSELKGPVEFKQLSSTQIDHEVDKIYDSIFEKRFFLGNYSKEVFKEFLKGSSFPKGIKDTLRDSLTYLYVDHYANSNSWSQTEKMNIENLNLKELLRATNLPSTHPLEKISFALNDLSEWNRKKHNPAGQLEAKLKLASILKNFFNSKFESEALFTYLTNEIEKLRNNSWYTMGLAQIIELLSDEDNSIYNPTLALKFAVKCKKIYPKSPGHSKCIDQALLLNQPFYTLEALRTFSNNKKTIGGTFKNISKLYFRSYPLNIFTQNRYIANPNYKFLLNEKPAYEWEATLKDNHDLLKHNYDLTIPEHQNGYYIIITSTNKEFSMENNEIKGVEVFISNLHLTINNINTNNNVFVEIQDSLTGALLKDVNVSLIKNNLDHKDIIASTLKSDTTGSVTFKTSEFDKNNRFYLIANYKANTAISSSLIDFPKSINSFEPHSKLITDYKNYKIGQKIVWKAITYKKYSNSQNIESLANYPLTIQIKDPMNTPYITKKISSNNNGYIDGNFYIPPGRPSGKWSITVSTGETYYFFIEEPKLNTFEISIKETKNLNIQSDGIRYLLNANYFFGYPVVNAKARWQYSMLIKSGSKDLNDFKDNKNNEQDKKVTLDSGEGILNSQGELYIIPSNEVLNILKRTNENIIIEAEVINSGGEKQTLSKSISNNTPELKIQIYSKSNFFTENNNVDFTILKTNFSKTSTLGETEWQLFKLSSGTLTKKIDSFEYYSNLFPDHKWNFQYNQERYLANLNEKELILSGILIHKNDGFSKLNLKPLTPGIYRLNLKTKDNNERIISLSRNFLVTQNHLKFNIPLYLDILKDQVKANETAKIFAYTSFKNQEMTLEVFQNKNLIQKKIINSNDVSSLIDLNLNSKLYGIFDVCLRLINSNQQYHTCKPLYILVDKSNLLIKASMYLENLKNQLIEHWKINLKPSNSFFSEFNLDELKQLLRNNSLSQLLNLLPNSDDYCSHSIFSQYPIPEENLQANAIYFTTEGFKFNSKFQPFQNDVFSLFVHKNLDLIKSNYSTKKAEPISVTNTNLNIDSLQNLNYYELFSSIDPETGLAIEFTSPAQIPSPMESYSFNNTSSEVNSNSLEDIDTQLRNLKDFTLFAHVNKFYKSGIETPIKIEFTNLTNRELKLNINLKIDDLQLQENVSKEFITVKEAEKLNKLIIPAKGSLILPLTLKTPQYSKNIYSLSISANTSNYSTKTLNYFSIIP